MITMKMTVSKNLKMTIYWQKVILIIRYVLTFFIIVFLHGVLYIFSPSYTCIY
jgi:hypothetical protein